MDAPNSPEGIRFFEQHVRPLLVAHCQECHAGNRQRGGLRLDSRQAVLDGGDSGPAVVPGDPGGSLLIEAVRRTGFEMPPDETLKEEQIATLAQWVSLGAPWPDEPAPVAGPQLRRGDLRAEDREHWAFRPIAAPPLPELSESARQWAHNEIDAFVAAAQEREGLTPAPEADRVTLIRRVYFDLLGLPPTWEEVTAFVADPDERAYERLVDRLLERPEFGERWGRHWLDLVRYAESDGYKQDSYRPDAWRYRDYVVDSLNADKPYDQFVTEQLAGDEFAPHDPQALVATGYLRHTIYEYNQRDVRTQWDGMLNEITDVTADVFLGMGLGCARCHNHKFDPLLQRDYFRLRAFFEPLSLQDRPVASADEQARYAEQLAVWEQETAEIRRQIAEIEQPLIDRAVNAAIEKFPKDVRPMLRAAREARSPYEQQIAELAGRQMTEERANIKFADKLKGEQKAQWEQLQARLREHDAQRPQPLPSCLSVADVGERAPETQIPDTDTLVAPGFLTVLDSSDATITAPFPGTTGRRLALARWLVSPENPLTSRVLVNRLWKEHFGRGLASTPSDFGTLGEPPSHPELLDWLASQLIAGGWRMKSLHRAMVLSATYRQSSHHPDPRAAETDPDNRWLTRRPVRRVEAEVVRDSLLRVAGELSDSRRGPSTDDDAHRRSVYSKVIRNDRFELLAEFDGPDGFSSVDVRNVTTTPTQALLMINGPWVLARAGKLAERLQVGGGSSRELVLGAWHDCYQREPDAAELAWAEEFLAGEAEGLSRRLTDLCHVLLTSSEFVYVD